MYRRNTLDRASNTPHLAKQLAQLLPYRNIRKALRVMKPTLIVLSFSSLAHAQGTMDFSGAQTLMGTFNVGPAAIQANVRFPNCIQLVPEQAVCPV